MPAPTSPDLKAQGNALFSAKNYKEAEKKYTGAIEAGDEVADPKGLAILYANRAACRLSLKRYVDTERDSTKATVLDPTYAKAFARLATAQDAQGKYDKSKESWQHALDVLPQTDLKPAEQVQKSQYEVGLSNATAALIKAQTTVVDRTDPHTGPVVIQGGQGRMPWYIAATIVPRLRMEVANNLNLLASSAWVIHHAYEEFARGLKEMKDLKPLGNLMQGTLGAIDSLSNGLMRDLRVFHITDHGFVSRYNKQIIFEAQARRAWTEGGPELVIREALARQRKEGWSSTRPAVALTVRAWIMRATFESGLRRNHHVAAELYKNALDVLHKLKEHWILESRENRGTVFEQSFIFGVKHLYIDALMHTYDRSNPSTELLEDLLRESDLLIREVDQELEHPSQNEVDPGFVSSFYLYPRGQAYTMKGFYYAQMAKREGNDSSIFFHKAAREYLKATESFPIDDENHPYFLNVALELMSQAHTFPIREILDVMKRIRLSIPKAKEIWQRSALSSEGLWTMLERVASDEQELRNQVAEGKVNMDSTAGCEPI
ncbi:hypothetical protein C8F04DRAFT_1130473 [Mycena alexandri]|uniref:TPR-like protein n=1 Tax=Mycena alexandri TaxID=1745969 RepID=A0AAD6WVB4_9AGAR|nr:hypothetical protein C8F04DRAFT_1130473 [Mycena alexandri]